MAFPFKRILNPIDFDDNSMAAVELAAKLARQNDGTAFLLHVVPLPVQLDHMPVYVDIYREQEALAKEKLQAVTREHLQGVKFEILVQGGDPAGMILGIERRLAIDAIVMATHGRQGFSRVFLGSIAEVVLREASCPVLTVHHWQSDRNLVGRWMTSNISGVAPEEMLSAAQTRMRQSGLHCVPVLHEGKLVGLLNDHDLYRFSHDLDQTEVGTALSQELITVTPETTIHDAARLLRERKVDALAVVQNGALVGMILAVDLLDALVRANFD